MQKEFAIKFLQK